jgi:hypothetical protein
LNDLFTYQPFVVRAPDPFPCPRCQTWHLPPRCEHDAETDCPSCGGARGYLWTGMRDGERRCWKCAERAEQLIATSE